MSFFDEPNQSYFEPVSRRPRRASGLVFLSLFAISLIGLVFLPTPYVIEQPGPVFNVLSVENGESVITVENAKTYETKGDLDLLTVSVLGSRENTPSWLELGWAWLDPAKVITPIDAIFPEGQTTKQAEVESAAMMEQSQQDAIAVALKKLGYKVPFEVYISEVLKGAPASGILRATDFVKTASGIQVQSVEQLRAILNESNGQPVAVEIERAGKLQTVEVTPTKNEAGDYRMGVLAGIKYDFPIQVNLKLSDVGGPSGGMIFALGIYDILTPGYLVGGEKVAGTGTIDGNGNIGPIGGIRQKMHGAQRAGASYFLAPADNCSQVIGNIPEGLKVFKVSKFDEALEIANAIGSDGNLNDLPTCSAK